MKIYIAAITHKHGQVLYAALSEADRTAKVADYCRNNWHELSDEVCEENAERKLTDQEEIDIYFAAENMGEHEYVEMQEDETWDAVQTALASPEGQRAIAETALSVYIDDGKPKAPGQLPHETYQDAEDRRSRELLAPISPRPAPIDPYDVLSEQPACEPRKVTPPAEPICHPLNAERHALLAAGRRLTALRNDADNMPHGLELNAPHFIAGIMHVLGVVLAIVDADHRGRNDT